MQESINNNPNNNPFLQVENPYDQYYKSAQQSIHQKHIQDMIEINRLCYQIFERTEDGKQLHKALVDKFIIDSSYDKDIANVEKLSLYWKGFTDCIRNLKGMALVHAQMINHPQPEVK